MGNNRTYKKKKQEDNKEVKTVGQILKDCIKQIFEGKESMLAIVSVILPVFSIFIVYLFKGAVYIYEMGYYAYWNIPMVYIEIEYQHIFWEFITVLAFMILFLIISFLFNIFYYNFKFVGKLLCLLTVPVIVFLILVAYLLMHFSPKEVGLGIIFGWPKIVKVVLSLSVIIMPILFSISGLFVINELRTNEKYESINKKCEKGKEENGLNRQRVVYRNGKEIGLACMVVGLVIFVCQIYSYGNENYRNRKSVETTSLEGEEYIVAGKNEKQWVLKPCKIDEVNNVILVSRDNFKIEKELTNIIRVYKLNSKVETQLKFASDF